jgi:hypothetical protein
MAHIREDRGMIEITCPCGNQAIGEFRVKHGSDGTIILTPN